MTRKPVEPTPEFLQHHSTEKVETSKAGKRRTRVNDQRWIDYYFKHGHINKNQFNAAEMLLALYRATGRMQKLTASLNELRTGSNTDTSEFGYSALKDYNKLKKMLGTESFKCLEDIVVYDFSAPQWAKRHERNPKASTEILRMSLDHLEEAFKNLRNVSPN